MSDDGTLACVEREADELARVLAHMSGAITGHLKPAFPYPGKPLRVIEEGLCLYRAAQILAGSVIRLRQGREAMEVEIQAEILWTIKLAEKELESILPDPERKVPFER